jgi:hypothetical protein
MFSWMLDVEAPVLPKVNPSGHLLNLPPWEMESLHDRSATPLSATGQAMSGTESARRAHDTASPAFGLLQHACAESNVNAPFGQIQTASALGYSNSGTAGDGILQAALQRAAGIRNGAEAVIRSGWNKLAARIGLHTSVDDPLAAAVASHQTLSEPQAKLPEKNTQDLATLLRSTGDAFSFADTASSKRKRSTISAQPVSDRGKRRRTEDELNAVVLQPTQSATRAPSRSGALQRRIAELESDNDSLRAQLQALVASQTPDASEFEEERRLQLQTISGMIATSTTPESQLRRALVQYKEAHADCGRNRQIAIKFHIRCLRRLLHPTNVTRLLLFIVASGSSRTIPSGVHADRATMWQALVNACEFSEHQQQQILGLRDSVCARGEEVAEVQSLLNKLEQQATTSLESLEFQLNLFMSHLAPRQVALFLQWLENMDPKVFATVQYDTSSELPPAQSSLPDPVSAAAALRAKISRSRKKRTSSIDAAVLDPFNHAPTDTKEALSGGLFGSGFSLPSIPIPSILSNGLHSVSNALPNLSSSFPFLAATGVPGLEGAAET